MFDDFDGLERIGWKPDDENAHDFASDPRGNPAKIFRLLRCMPFTPESVAVYEALQIKRAETRWSWLAPYAKRIERAILLILNVMIYSGAIVFAASLFVMNSNTNLGLLLFSFGITSFSVSVPLQFAYEKFMSGKTIKGYARWRDYDYDEYPPALIPDWAKELADLLRTNLPDARLIVRALVQDEVILDPFLVAEQDDSRDFVAVWRESDYKASTY